MEIYGLNSIEREKLFIRLCRQANIANPKIELYLEIE